MWNVLKSDFGKSALAAAACAAVILVASPVSAATVEEGQQAAADFRAAVLAECADYAKQGKANCMGQISNARQQAAQTHHECLAAGNTKDYCDGVVADFWVKIAN